MLRGGARWMIGAVAAVFLAAGVAKAFDGRTAALLVASTLDSFPAGRFAVSVAAGLEVAVGTLLLLRPTRDLAWFSLLFLAGMTAWLLHLDVTRGMDVPCGCGIPLLGEKGWGPLLRNANLLALCPGALRRRRGGGGREGS